MTQLEKIKKLCDEATEGPWVKDSHGVYTTKAIPQDHRRITFSNDFSPLSTSNDIFIAHSRTIIPALVKVIELQREALQDIHTSVNASTYCASGAIIESQKIIEELEL